MKRTKVLFATLLLVAASAAPVASAEVKVFISQRFQVERVFAQGGGKLRHTKEGYYIYTGTGQICVQIIDKLGQRFTLCRKSDGKSDMRF